MAPIYPSGQQSQPTSRPTPRLSQVSGSLKAGAITSMAATCLTAVSARNNNLAELRAVLSQRGLLLTRKSGRGLSDTDSLAASGGQTSRWWRCCSRRAATNSRAGRHVGARCRRALGDAEQPRIFATSTSTHEQLTAAGPAANLRRVRRVPPQERRPLARGRRTRRRSTSPPAPPRQVATAPRAKLGRRSPSRAVPPQGEEGALGDLLNDLRRDLRGKVVKTSRSAPFARNTASSRRA